MLFYFIILKFKSQSILSMKDKQIYATRIHIFLLFYYSRAIHNKETVKKYFDLIALLKLTLHNRVGHVFIHMQYAYPNKPFHLCTKRNSLFLCLKGSLLIYWVRKLHLNWLTHSLRELFMVELRVLFLLFCSSSNFFLYVHVGHLLVQFSYK